MKKRYIGIFDSGLGGLTTVSEVLRELPEENIVFIADTANMPYGPKSREVIASCSLNCVALLNDYDLKALVIACNTSDAAVGDRLRSESPIPVFGVIEPAARKAAEVTENKKVGVIATSSTVQSGRYTEMIHTHDGDIEVYSVACPDLTPMIESGAFIHDQDSLKDALKTYLSNFEGTGIDTLVLGCTHYDILSGMIQEMFPDLKLVSSSRQVVTDLKSYLEENDCREKEKEAETIFLSTSDPKRINQTASYLIENAEFKEKMPD